MELLFPLLVLALLVPMFLGIRRQKKEMAKTTELQDSLQIGDRVLTTAGLHAVIDDLDETTVDLEIAPGIVTTWSRVVVREVLTDDEDTDEYESDEADDTTVADVPAVEETDAPAKSEQTSSTTPGRLTKD